MRVGTFVLAAQFPGQGPGEALHRALRSAEVAEESGLDSVWLAEHHFVPYGVCPSAVTLAALLLGRTRRIRVGTAVSVLPTQHPVALGEQAALLHLTSGGRFSLGVGRGGPWVDLEVFGGGLEAYEKGFPESLGLLLDWLREPRVAGRGERYAFQEVAVVPPRRRAARRRGHGRQRRARGDRRVHLAQDRGAGRRERPADAARDALAGTRRRRRWWRSGGPARWRPAMRRSGCTGRGTCRRAWPRSPTAPRTPSRRW
ncbi:hypothetical protein JCM13580A_19650 [Streptomyces drozdowiczii]